MPSSTTRNAAKSSNTSRTRHDSRAVAALHAEADVEEYWIVRPRDRQIEAYRQPGGGT